MEIAEDSCRICLGKSNLSEIFNENCNIADKIMYCATVEISFNDDFPKMICNQCLFYLDIAYIFRTVCEATDNKLRKQIDSVEEEQVVLEQNEEIVEGSSSSGEVEINLKENLETCTETVGKDTNKNKVGRHIAKKNAGKCPRRYQQTDEKVINDVILTQTQTEVEELKVDDVADIGEHILESDIPMPVFELTVISEDPDEPPAKEVKKIKYKKRIKLKKKLKFKMIPLKGTKNTKKVCKSLEDISKTKSKEFQCKLCPKSFPYQSHLIRHMSVHNGVKKYVCSYCSKKFINQYNLTVHLQKHTGNFPLKCKLCGRGFSTPSLLKRHMNAHTGTLNYQCRYCLKKFLHSSSLKLHEKMHLNRPSYSCDICFKIFSYTNSLAEHKKTHLGLKQHSCSVCYKTFTRKTSLGRHMLSHTNSKKFKCKICPMAFNSSNNYAIHLKSHSKYKCSVCNETCNNKTMFVNHLKKHKESLKCEQCFRQFTNKAQLIKHLQKHVGMEDNNWINK